MLCRFPFIKYRFFTVCEQHSFGHTCTCTCLIVNVQPLLAVMWVIVSPDFNIQGKDTPFIGKGTLSIPKGTLALPWQRYTFFFATFDVTNHYVHTLCIASELILKKHLHCSLEITRLTNYIIYSIIQAMFFFMPCYQVRFGIIFSVRG